MRLRTADRDGEQSIKDIFLRLVSKQEDLQERHRQYVPQAALRSVNFCQQILSTELGWPTSRSLNTWRAVQARQNVTQLQLPAVHDASGNRQDVEFLQLQPRSTGSAGNETLAAVGFRIGMMHLIKLSDMLQTARRANFSSAALGSVRNTASAASCRQPSAAAAVPAGSVMTVDLQDRLLSCCWAPPGGESAEMVTAGAQGVKIRRFVEGRHHEYSLKLRQGSQLAKAGHVKYLDRSAAYQVVAAKPSGLVLWDCRAASKAVWELATSSTATLLQPMPGGTVLLTASADGQMALYDVRRSSNSSSVVNFGGSRTPQQLTASYNIPARADEALGAVIGGSCLQRTADSSGVRPYPYFSDVQLNPADCNLVAYVRPDLQVGVFDLYHNKVLQQVCVTDTVGTAAGAAGGDIVNIPRQAPFRCCWDAQGHVLYTHGLLQRYDIADGATCSQVVLQPTVTAVDFGSWHGRQHRRDSSRWCGSREPPATVDELQDLENYVVTAACSEHEPQAGGEAAADCRTSSLGGSEAAYSSGFMSAGVMCQGGQVVHLPLEGHLVPTEFTVCSGNGELLCGTLQGDVLCIG